MTRKRRSFMDLVGERYGELIVIGGEIPDIGKKRFWTCRCDCGGIAIVAHANLRNGHTTSCGCKRVAVGKVVNLKHGRSSGGVVDKAITALYSARRRCYTPTNNKYQDYGGRGITVCREWMDNPQAFLDYMGPRPDGYSLDRIDVNGNYEPGNVRWASAKTQANNRRARRGRPENEKLQSQTS